MLEALQDATMEIQVPFLRWRLVALPREWIRQYFFTDFGAVHVCYIAEYDIDS